MKLTVMSFNTQHCENFLTKQIDYDVMVKAIRDCGADIVGLNEIRDQGTMEGYEPQAKALAERLGYYYYFAKAIDVGEAPNPYGNALVSRYPILTAETIMVPDPTGPRTGGKWYETRCLLKAKIDVGDGLTVCVMHFGLNRDEQVNAVETAVANIEEKTCVLMGDFNVIPEDPVLAPIREVLYDTAELFEGERLSWPSDTPERKIDYLFTSKDIKVHSADIPAIVASDHRPYVAEIEW
ncbi:MAG: endonuclease/exonuclease/phosphatase family protein [Clostridia bacterium]|nr:endonuclease/exonuclease/phosphatase family protein [Clostridia bacterium]